METTITRAVDIARTGAREGDRLGRTQRLAFADEAAQLTDEQWGGPSGCDRWTVWHLVAHVVAQAENQAHPLSKTLASIVAGKVRYRRDNALDAMNEMGIDRHRDMTPAQLLGELRRLAPVSTTPRWFWRAPLSNTMGLPAHANGGYLGHVIYVRDTWMHRVELAHATGQSLEPDPDTAAIVAQVVRDLGRQWRGPDTVLTLTGPAGGTWLLGRGPATGTTPTAKLPAIEFMLHLSGREADKSMFDAVPEEVRQALVNARVTF